MNITIISILLPYPLDSGGAQAQYNMIDILRKQHNISIIYPENYHNSNQALSKLKELWPEVTFYPFSFLKQMLYPHFIFSKIERAIKLKLYYKNRNFLIERILRPCGYDISPLFVSFINKIIKKQKSDIIQIEFYPYLEIINHIPKQIKTVFIHHELRYVRNERMLNDFHLTKDELHKAYQIKENEIKLLNKYDAVVTLTDIDKAILNNDGVNTTIVSSPAAVNTPIKQYKGWNGKIVFIGGAGHGPNREGIDWLCKNVFSSIDWNGPFKKVSVIIIGGGWHENMFSNIPKNNLTIMGFVPELSDAAYGGILIVPILSGSGMRMKILDGAALSLPMITTSIGVEGLNFTNESSCLIADTATEFKKALTVLISDERKRKKIADNARQVFIKNYSKEALANKRNSIYNNLL